MHANIPQATLMGPFSRSLDMHAETGCVHAMFDSSVVPDTVPGRYRSSVSRNQAPSYADF